MNPKTKSLCTLPMPYPEIRVEGENKNYAKMLSIAYAGADGELSAILNYIYSHIVTDGKKPYSLCDVFECIAVVEMRHFETLGKLIFLLGEDPKFYSAMGRRSYFNTGTLSYANDVSQILKNSIAGEKKAVDFYRELSKVISDVYIKQILDRIILDEEHHIKIFSELLENPHTN